LWLAETAVTATRLNKTGTPLFVSSLNDRQREIPVIFSWVF